MAANGAEFSFLGYRFKRHTDRRGRSRVLRLVSRKSGHKLRDRLRDLTARCNANGLPEVVRSVNRTLHGWYNYFRHCFASELAGLDRFVRRRLRRILRKRAKRRRGTGRSIEDHLRWPNAFFGAAGLFSLEEARCRELQSLRGTRWPESRMREIRTYGSEGGAAQSNAPSLPLSHEG